jgi:hypothetical protein
MKDLIARGLAEEKYARGWRPPRLLSRSNTKLAKADRNVGLSLAPADLSGFQVCASSSVECRKHCIHTSGMAGPNFHAITDACNPVWVARIVKTLWFFRDRASFMERLYKDVALNRDSSIRLNVFSDWMWERQSLIVTPELAAHYGTAAGRFRNIMEVFPQTQFYDYTKHFARMSRDRPENYHLTFSLTEVNEVQARVILGQGMNVAAVVSSKEGFLLDHPIIDGDINDLRFLDPQGVIVGLKPKGSLRKAKSEFVYGPGTIRWQTTQAA